jgi:NAD(P)-dependent dehydrogenase (short-subunit alcohol dehydrogenase family)
MIVAAGGTALPVRVDHSVESEVKELFERVDRDHGRLDVIVDSVGGEDPLMGAYGWFWAADLTNTAKAIENSLLSHIITAKHAAQMMMRARRGLIVEVTENNLMGAGGNPAGQIVKFGLKGQTLNMATELYPHGVAVVAITPGFLRSETMLEHFGVKEKNWRDGGKMDKNFLTSESPLYVGRAVAALAQDPNIMKRTGQLLSSWELSREYKFTDADGSRPDWGRIKIDLSRLPPGVADYIRIGNALQLQWLETVAQRSKSFAKQLPKMAAPKKARAKKARVKSRTRPTRTKAQSRKRV